MIQAVVLPGALKGLHIAGRLDHADGGAVPLGAGTDGAELGLGVVLADAAAVEPGVGVLDGLGQRCRVRVRHTQHLIGHPGRALAADARELAELLNKLFQRRCGVTHDVESSFDVEAVIAVFLKTFSSP